eukprot:c37528_g1_i1 orf=673-4578(-)
MAEDKAMDTAELIAGQGDDLHAQVMSRYKNSPALEHRHLCAVVSAMAAVIKEQGMPSTPTAFFAATMSALDRQSKTMSVGEDHVTTALCTFLALTLPKVSPAVLQTKGRPGLSLLVTIVGTGNLSPGGLKPALTCITALLRVADSSDWLSLAPGFNILLKHCLDQRPKVRKRAHECTGDALRGFQNSTSLVMASEAIVTLFERSFLAVSQSKEGNSGEKTSGRAGSSEALQILHLLNALKLFLPRLSGKSMGKIFAIFNKLLELRQHFLSRQILNTLQPLCTDSTAEIPAGALCDLLERLAGMILEEKKAGDESMVAARVLAKGMERLHVLDPRSCALKLPLVFQSLAGMLAFEQEEAVFAAADCLKSLIQNCIDNAIIEQGKSALQSRGNSLNLVPTAVERICVTASSLLGYQFSTAWDVCLQVVASLFDKLGGASYILMADSVQALADLEGLSDENLTCRRQLHRTVGAAVAAMGPENFLTLLPFNLDDGDLSNARVWLLPVLRQNIVGAQLRFFTEKMLPLIQRLQDELKKLSAEGKMTAAKKTEAHVQALWALFPAFCNFPSDTAQSFGRVAKHVGGVLSEDPELRGVICYGLQMLIKQNRAALGELVTFNVSAEDSVGMYSVNKAAEEKAKALYTERFARANISAIASFSKNFLPLLFNVFIAAPSEKRGMLQATIGELASISEKKIVRDFFVSIMQKLLKATKEAGDNARVKGAEPMDISGPKKEESASSNRCIFMDLALSLLRGLDDESVGVLFTAIKPTLQDGDGSVQKKGYKVLAGLCKEHTGFLAIRCNDTLELMLMAMPSCHFSAKRQRLNCLHPLILHIFRSKNQDADKVLSSFIGEIVLATKETNIKTRTTAYDILVQLGHSLKDTDPVGCDGKLIQFFTMIVGCLAGTSPHMRSAAITGLARLIYEFHDLCHTIPDLLPSVLLLLQSKSREVIKSVLGFLKVVVARQPAEHLQHHLKSMVEGLLLWSDDSKNHFKAKVRVIFEMLVRRCGLPAVLAVTPEQHTKLLTHIRKMKERKEKKEGDDSKSIKSHATTARQSKWQHTQFFSDGEDEGGSDDDDADQLTITSARKSRATTARSNRKLRKASKMLPEDEWDGENEPLDLLDTQKTRSVLSINKLKRKDYDSDDMEYDPDGRLIVPDETASKGKRKDFGDRDNDIRSSKGGKSPGKGKPKVHATKKRKTDTGWAYTGQEYASKKGAGRGDVKQQGKLDPYAYWPLDPKMLNRREGKKVVARKGLTSVMKVTNKMKGLSASEAVGMKHTKEALGLKHTSGKGKQKFHKSKGKGKRK